MLTKAKKKEMIDEIVAKIGESKSIIFIDYKGISSGDMVGLKKDLRKEGVEMKVFKKTLMSIAFKQAGIEADFKSMEGQIAVNFSRQDEVAPAKILQKFAKTNENLKMAGGVLGSKIMTAADVVALAKLPSKQELLGRLVGSLNSPMSGLANVMAGNIRGLVQVIKGISEAKAN